MKLTLAIVLFAAPLMVVAWYVVPQWLAVRQFKRDNRERLRRYHEITSMVNEYKQRTK